MLLVLLAQAPVAAMAAPATQAPTVEQGVIAYPASFFADQQLSNAADMLARLPGFSLDTGATQRGFEGGGGNALINGQRPVSKTDGLNEILRRIPAGKVERIELIRGGAPGVDMQGKTLVANVVLKPGAAMQGALTVLNKHVGDGRDLPTAQMELSGGLGAGRWELSARYESKYDDGGSSGGQIRLSSAGDLLRRSTVLTHYDGVQQAATAAYERPVLGGEFRVNARFSAEKWKRDEDTNFSAPAALGAEQLDNTDKGLDREIGGRFTRSLGPTVSLELVGLHQAVTLDSTSAFASPSGGSVFALRRDTGETIARAVGRWRPQDSLSLEVGAETAVNTLASQTRLTVDGAPAVLPAANVTVRERRSEAFTKALWRPNSSVSLDGGLRFEASSITSGGDVALEKDTAFAKPHLALNWTLRPGTQVRARVERRVGQLNFDHLVAKANFNTGAGVASGNPDINPERAWIYEAGVEQRFLKTGVAAVTLRRSLLTDVIDRGPVRTESVDPATGMTVTRYFDQPANVGAGTKDEAIAELTLPFDGIGLRNAQLKSTGTWRRSSVDDPATGLARPISGLRHLEWNASFTHALPVWKAQYGVEMFSGWDRTFYTFNAVEQIKLRNAYLRTWIEWNPRADWNLRLELASVGDRGLRVTRYVWPSLRTPAGAAYVDNRRLHSDRMVLVRLRKSFG